MPDRQRADAVKNRERLISEARRLFSEGGEPTTLGAIAQAAGVGIGTLYRHFPTREALIEAVYKSELDRLDQEAEALLASRPSFEAMRSWLDVYARFVATKHAMHDALRVALAPRSNPQSDLRARISSTIAKFLEAGARDGGIRSDVLPDDVTLSFAGAVYAATSAASQEQVRRVLDLLMAGLRGSAR